MTHPRRSRILKPGKQFAQKAFRRVSETELRRIFREEKFYEKVLSGEFSTEVHKNGHPSPPLADEVECTWSQYVFYYDRHGNKVAEIHQYLRPDGKLGASGLPDPKVIRHKGEMLMLDAP